MFRYHQKDLRWLLTVPCASPSSPRRGCRVVLGCYLQHCAPRLHQCPDHCRDGVQLLDDSDMWAAMLEIGSDEVNKVGLRVMLQLTSNHENHLSVGSPLSLAVRRFRQST